MNTTRSGTRSTLTPSFPFANHSLPVFFHSFALPANVFALCMALSVPVSANQDALGLPSEGLVLHFDAGQGVLSSGDIVSQWNNQVGQGPSLQASGQPRLIAQGLNGRPIVELNDAAQSLRQSGTSSLPTHNNDRTLVVLSASSKTKARVGYGGTGCGAYFGFRQDEEGYTGLARGCDDNAFAAQKQANAGQWDLHVLQVRSGIFYYLRNGKWVDGRSTGFDTQPGAFEIKARIADEARSGSLKIATVLAYNWALGKEQLTNIQRYIGNRWFREPDRYEAAPNLQHLDLPTPQISFEQSAGSESSLHLTWRVSFADGCSPTTGWTQASAAAGEATIRDPQPGATYGLTCWHNTESARATLSADTRAGTYPAGMTSRDRGIRQRATDCSLAPYRKVTRLP